MGSFNILGILPKKKFFFSTLLLLFAVSFSASSLPSTLELWVKTIKVQMVIRLW